MLELNGTCNKIIREIKTNKTQNIQEENAPIFYTSSVLCFLTLLR